MLSTLQSKGGSFCAPNLWSRILPSRFCRCSDVPNSSVFSLLLSARLPLQTYFTCQLRCSSSHSSSLWNRSPLLQTSSSLRSQFSRCGAVKLGRIPLTSSSGNYCSGDKRRHLHCIRHTVTGSMTHHRKLRGEKPTTHSVRSVQVEKKDVKADFTVKSSDFTEPHEVQKILNNSKNTHWELHLKALQDAGKLNTLSVVELREYMRKMGKSVVGRKDELITEVRSWLSANLQEDPISHESNQSNAAITKSVMKKIQKEAGDKTNPQDDKCLGPKQKKKKKQRGQDDLPDLAEYTADADEVGDPPSKRKRRESLPKRILSALTETNGENYPWTVLVHRKPQPHWVAYNPALMRPSPPATSDNTMKLLSWNVNGLRALLKEKGVEHAEGSLIARLALREDFDILCLQETKLQEKHVEEIQKSLSESYAESSWSCSTSKLGYSGTAIISRNKPLSVRYGLGIPEHDTEGRVITAEFNDFYIVVSYVPNSGNNRLTYRTEKWDPDLSHYLKVLEQTKPVILTGDLNCAHQEIDIHHPDGNLQSAGYTPEERASFARNFLEKGFVDTFRNQHPNAVGYTYWGYRSGARPKNQGWRLDYFLVSELLANRVYDSYILPDVDGSDHCPIGLILKM
ncbi:hypothetical protein CY35_12G064700 [Sphagnum magellanicum]|nr:hypothetical protein CY35_12G064700 [Sphagnum magellanicum]